jgi:hypothetical protein
MKSPKEVKALLQLKNMFKASISQIVINKSTMCKDFGMTRVPFSNFITRLISYNFLIELSDKRFNFITKNAKNIEKIVIKYSPRSTI